MRNSSLEQRVEMIQNIREITANNERTMSNIHNLVSNTAPMDTSIPISKSKFKYRMLIAVILFGIYVFSDVEKLQYKGYTTEDIDKIIAYNIDYEEILQQVNNQLTNAISIK
jgi:hypothetical protein